VAPDALYEAVVSMRVEIVLTAHPTAITRRSLREAVRIAQALERRDREDLTVDERLDIETTCAVNPAVWGTEDVRLRRPDADGGSPQRACSFGRRCGRAARYLRSLDRALREATGRGLRSRPDADRIRIVESEGIATQPGESLPAITREACEGVTGTGDAAVHRRGRARPRACR